MKILLVDRSGRGHAFADLFSRTSKNTIIHYAPGCPAVTTPRVVSRPELLLSDPAPMVQFASTEAVDLVFVANTMALADGFVDAFRAAGLPVIGPDRAASRLESSKIYSKGLFARYGIPSPRYVAFSEPKKARAWVRQVAHQVVVKADGLCGGNGAFVCDDEGEALAAIDRLMVQRVFGEAGSRIVIEERLHGREVSFFVLLDGGEGHLMLPMALDYPKSDDGNRGVISAGMGALSPHPLETASLIESMENKILHPLLGLLAAERLRYNGVIYLGCMLVEEEPYLLEINARMGDPEAEVVFPRIESDFGEICRAILSRQLSQCSLELNDLCCCDVVATQGPTRANGNGPPQEYPGWPFGTFGRHYPITGLEAVDSSLCRVFLGEAAVLPHKGLVTDGGRAVHVVGLGRSTGEAVENAYANIAHVRFEGIRYRGDIGRTMPWDG